DIPDDLKSVLEGRGNNNGANGNHEFYGASHLLIHDTDIPGSLVPILPGQPDLLEEPDVIISMGGHKEEFFYRLRYALKPKLGDHFKRVNTVQYFTRHHVPPYYMARDGDVAF